MALTNTGAKAVKLSKPTHIIVTPFDGNTKGADVYDLDDVIRDTVSISQDDNETTDIERETSDTPILSIVTTGKYQFAAEVADTQADVLKALCGFTVDTDGKVYAPSTYQAMYAEIVVVIPNGSKNVGLILPKVQLNSKTTIESLNTNMAKVALAGTGQLVEITLADKTTKKKVPFYIDPDYQLPK